jgi:chitodextrinase
LTRESIIYTKVRVESRGLVKSCKRKLWAKRNNIAMTATRIRLILITSLIVMLTLATACTTRYTLSTSVSPSGSGTISPASGIYDGGTEVTLAAIPENGWSFVEWSGDTTGKTNPITITMDSDKSITARFSTPPRAQISLNPTTVQVGEEASFSAAGSTDPDNNIVSYEWDFGDQKTASGMTATHSYSQWGHYTAKLTVRDSDGLSDTSEVEVLVASATIAISFSSSSSTGEEDPYLKLDNIIERLESQGFAAYEFDGNATRVVDGLLFIYYSELPGESSWWNFPPANQAFLTATDIDCMIRLWILGMDPSTYLYEDDIKVSTPPVVSCSGGSDEECLRQGAIEEFIPKFEDSFAEMIEILQAALSP